jgi:predicted Zn-dependent peptidase
MTFFFTVQNFPELRSPKVPESSKTPPPLKKQRQKDLKATQAVHSQLLPFTSFLPSPNFSEKNLQPLQLLQTLTSWSSNHHLFLDLKTKQQR